MSLWGKVVEGATRLLKGGEPPHEAPRRPNRERPRPEASDFLDSDLRSRSVVPESSPFESSVLREIRRVVTPAPAPNRPAPAPPEPSRAPSPEELRRQREELAARGMLNKDEPEELAAPVDWEQLYRLATSGEEVLPPDVLRYFDALGIMPVTGVNDPAMQEKLEQPGRYGWNERVDQASTRSGAANPTLCGMRMWRLTAPSDGEGLVGQTVIMSDAGDVYVETVGPWGSTWMHRSSTGVINCREHRIGPVRIPSGRPRVSRTQRASDAGPLTA